MLHNLPQKTFDEGNWEVRKYLISMELTGLQTLLTDIHVSIWLAQDIKFLQTATGFIYSQGRQAGDSGYPSALHRP